MSTVRVTRAKGFSRSGWQYLEWGVNVSFTIRTASGIPLRKVCYGFVNGATDTSGQLSIGRAETIPWGGIQVSARAGQTVTYTYEA